MENTNSPKNKNVLSIISLSISIFALSISGASFYFQYLYKYDNLKATILTVSPGYLGIACIADIVFTNNGNWECSVVSVDLEEEILGLTPGSPQSGYFWIPSLNQSPVSLKPKYLLSISDARPFNRRWS